MKENRRRFAGGEKEMAFWAMDWEITRKKLKKNPKKDLSTIPITMKGVKFIND